ncbi:MULTISPECIES: hypothetical protein [Enterobacter cloacae complex]|uniref:hypothetical protein n=1 Tax=Enterobacter cloacae complex TaxID=354276 RepID=UPI000908169D|nr:MULTISPECIES: hypothetical protein [Enterobacter cloacae complex]AVU50549.1 hypothetical protein AXJ76_10895 [Enterobacter cloacae]EHE7809947.1 hypothetical protein [Enterobacter hormaechei]EHF3574280.1 hypothetical protein [Enterobacter hormaechei]MBE8779208.1 hypothetical protein [Enterobacter hormaechei]MBO2808639.1 hypothetical protein [Enterobacter hormaechei]
MNVAFGRQFLRELQHYPLPDRAKILSFAKQVQDEGFANLPGRNKFSEDVDKNDPLFVQKVRYVHLHCLWHYHIGIIEYDTTKQFGDQTSEYVLHYARKEADTVKIVDYSAHPPFRLPTETYLE